MTRRLYWPRPKSPEERAKGFVYVIQRGDGVCKIGHTNNMKRRMAQFKTLYPAEPLVILLLIAAADRYRTETFLHRFFGRLRVEGEWFKLGRDEIARIRRWYAGDIVEAA